MAIEELTFEFVPRLKVRYGEPHRAYHTWAHIEALLHWFEKIKLHLYDPASVQLAIFYHDAIYDPHASDNEAQSAILMAKELEKAFPEDVLARTKALIIATATHQLVSKADSERTSDCAYFLDMDLSILGASQDDFAAYDNAIRQEYSFVPSEIYKPRRREILKNFTARERLYFTDYFHGMLDAQARENLAIAIERLGSPV